MARDDRNRHLENESRRPQGCHPEGASTLAAELASELAELQAQITGLTPTVDRVLLTELLSEEDCCAGIAVVREWLSSFVVRHWQLLRTIHRNYHGDPRRPGILDDVCCLLVFAGLERDRFAFRVRWPAVRTEAELRQLAAMWGTPIS